MSMNNINSSRCPPIVMAFNLCITSKMKIKGPLVSNKSSQTHHHHRQVTKD